MNTQTFSIWPNVVQILILSSLLVLVLKLKQKDKQKHYYYIATFTFLYQFIRENFIFLINGIYKQFFSENLMTQTLISNKNTLQKNNWLGTIITNNGYLEVLILCIYLILVTLIWFIFKGKKCNKY